MILLPQVLVHSLFEQNTRKMTSFSINRQSWIFNDSTSYGHLDHGKVRHTVPYRSFDPGSVRYGTGVLDGTPGRTERYTLVYRNCSGIVLSAYRVPGGPVRTAWYGRYASVRQTLDHGLVRYVMSMGMWHDL